MYQDAARFLLVGASNTALTYVLYLIFLMRFSPFEAVLITNVIGILYTSVLNLRFAFGADLSTRRMLASIGYLACYGLIFAGLVHLAAMFVPAWLAPVPVLAVVTPVHFLAYKYLVAPPVRSFTLRVIKH
jgi:putative flippase GtrA